MAASKNQKNSRAFAEQVLGDADQRPEALRDVEKAARARLDELELPGPKDEEWRFLRLRPLTGTEFVSADQVDGEVSAAMVQDYAVPEADRQRLVFVNGRFHAELSDTSGLSDAVKMGSLAGEELPEEVSERLGAVSGYYAEDYFLNLNQAGFSDGAFIYIPEETSVDGVLQVLYLATESAKPYAVHPRNVVVVGQGSKATLAESYVGPHSSTYFNNVVVEVAVAANATLKHARVQRDGQAAFHIGRTAIDLARSSTYDSQTISLGARLSRYDVYANGDAEEIDCTLDGLAVLGDKQVSDTHSVMDHRKAHAGSHQLHKMVIDDRAHAVFNGKIFVQQDAQIIDAYQLNRTLLLSEGAKVNAKPQLEIFADDVKCTHGATIGQIDEDQLFYLRTRGLDEETARGLLVFAFAAEVIESITIDSLKESLQDAVWRKTTEAGA